MPVIKLDPKNDGRAEQIECDTVTREGSILIIQRGMDKQYIDVGNYQKVILYND